MGSGASASASMGSARGSEPPERKDGQRERSSGREVPPDADGAMCERMAAAWDGRGKGYLLCG